MTKRRANHVGQRQVSFTGHRSQVTGYRSQKDISVGTRKVAIWSSEVV